MTILAIETSCDETSAAVVREGRVLSSVVSSQVKLHAEYGGVVPELAAREHLKNLLPVARTALTQQKLVGLTCRSATTRRGTSRPTRLDAVAATQGPGLPTALLVGFKAAQAVAFALRKPFVGIHHHEAHLYSPWIVHNPVTRSADTLSPPGGERVTEARDGEVWQTIHRRFLRLSTQRFPHRQRRAHACSCWWNQN